MSVAFLFSFLFIFSETEWAELYVAEQGGRGEMGARWWKRRECCFYVCWMERMGGPE